ncbi:HlyD family type I secretion periplasmic adaptor subunit [Erythrobacter sp. sf7]|uniref:Membrane fusion protein (MFP) family protein n=1 Tax=Erythrobacter fulvus TaxID=2987523 RepID=A0ABT5JR14_9SPHN|nr:HlyD family type I secretion periplasmic adaptor subunit [Erythrobacter fulvus]MDC8754956.1 HlyD family type I secretion periplasmic adaptor subunit [Erythrobacter fulvus]
MNLKQRFEELDANRKLIFVSSAALLLLVLWGSIAQVDEVTRGMGKVIPSSQAQLVQPAEPAVVADILVRSGEQVKQGQLLVRLDDSMAASELGQLQTENERLAARAARLEGEAGGSLMGCEPGSVCAEEQKLQRARLAAARSREASLSAAIDQRRRDLREAEATVASLQQSARLAQEQVRMLEPLAAQGIVPQTELLTAQRELVDVRGRLAAAQQSAGRASAAIREAQADFQSARLDFQQQALNERSEVETRIAVNEESIRGASARRNRNELRSPATGIVNNLQITTKGGFVNAGETIMQIVPVGDRLLVEARVSPRDIGFVSVNDPANVKITAYDFSTYGGLIGKVVEVSADSIYDEVERESYYRVIIETDRSFIEKNGQKFAIVPGMMTEVEIITGSKSILSYLLKPVAKAFDTALSEK